MDPGKFVFGRFQASHAPTLPPVGELKRCDRFELPERRKVYAYPDRL